MLSKINISWIWKELSCDYEFGDGALDIQVVNPVDAIEYAQSNLERFQPLLDWESMVTRMMLLLTGFHALLLLTTGDFKIQFYTLLVMTGVLRFITSRLLRHVKKHVRKLKKILLVCEEFLRKEQEEERKIQLETSP